MNQEDKRVAKMALDLMAQVHQDCLRNGEINLTSELERVQSGLGIKFCVTQKILDERATPMDIASVRWRKK